MKEKSHLNLQKFGILIDLHSMASQEMHDSGMLLMNTTDGLQLEIKWDSKGSGVVNCHIFMISDSQFNIEQTARICAVLKWILTISPSTCSLWG